MIVAVERPIVVYVKQPLKITAEEPIHEGKDTCVAALVVVIRAMLQNPSYLGRSSG
ncbi:hypothetical protein [Mycolicibacterium vanbaalenii]|uniref:hypothetical protein n=1 Tax=Mycolicibacterium vanbaalenii TaxID=110539 RepID=UPI0002D96B79|nr:hypothetical protein [Mycolicibacterium vanbaalenii]MCV7131023.1 hypothetical protein [Mycolicibacterium vanbaalenii PYR-1]